jgi:rhodanese-related sulfurtransferase
MMIPVCPPSLLNRRRLAGCFVALMSWPLLGGCGPSTAGAVSLDEARAALSDGRTLVFDIREPDEHARGVAAGMRLLPMSQLGARLAEIPKDPAQPVLLICNTQNRSAKAAEALRERGYTNVRHVQGGMSGWIARGWPVEAPR